ncbi:TetR/AcrR family transcriptional regulator [Mycobacterium koreense]|uniref:TetR family transcriptional regulator n=1 Tax=Mycolicibacillus koreensis TaxID=1069220 RepID=A0A7I7S8E9_9MYCO|nr:TetR/AcrR family transcriptional regulator [Mycolicibacillus koreensis]MCV7249169.1 TetR/AcrR family transcriptional regulator [Mycolicibacillus koreensis]OSC33454.1 TetR family transcriptional regulator [Mycolicibacillus koreensis]BBY53078.1 TetR family transcriptional regulator [Mycolicibacillus koreensis]
MTSVTRKPQAGRQARRGRIEQRMLAATERLMSRGASFTELSVERLSAEAGISRASFYIYFTDKGELLRRLATHVLGDLTEAAQSWWRVAWRNDPADIHRGMTGIVAGYRRHQRLLIALSEMSGYDPQVAATYRGLLTGIAGELTSVIVAGQDDGSIDAALPAEVTAGALTWMVERTCQQELPNRPPEYDAALAQALTTIVRGALYAPVPSLERDQVVGVHGRPPQLGG